MNEYQHPILPSQKKYIERFRDTLFNYLIFKGNINYTTLMGYKLDMKESLNLLNTLLYTNYYTDKDKEQLNEIRSMYISLTNEKVS
jgi:hypothetical protein